MADLTDTQASLSIKIVGADSTNTETNPVNSDGNGNLQVIDYSDGPVTPGTVAAKSSLGATQFNSTLPAPTNTQQVALQSDLNGRLLVSNSSIDGYKATYSASATGIATATLATDIFTLTGSASKTIRITRVQISTIAGSNATKDVVVLKRSTANSGGTSAAVTAVPHDSNNAAATATALSYTANPSLGSLVGNIASTKLGMPANNNGLSDRWILDFGNRPAQAIVLRGTSQVFAVNLNGVTTSGDAVDVAIEWTEE